jgi:hypothetical protein
MSEDRIHCRARYDGVETSGSVRMCGRLYVVYLTTLLTTRFMCVSRPNGVSYITVCIVRKVGR